MEKENKKEESLGGVGSLDNTCDEVANAESSFENKDIMKQARDLKLKGTSTQLRLDIGNEGKSYGLKSPDNAEKGKNSAVTTKQKKLKQTIKHTLKHKQLKLVASSKLISNKTSPGKLLPMLTIANTTKKNFQSRGGETIITCGGGTTTTSACATNKYNVVKTIHHEKKEIHTEHNQNKKNANEASVESGMPSSKAINKNNYKTSQPTKSNNNHVNTDKLESSNVSSDKNKTKDDTENNNDHNEIKHVNDITRNNDNNANIGFSNQSKYEDETYDENKSKYYAFKNNDINDINNKMDDNMDTEKNNNEENNSTFHHTEQLFFTQESDGTSNSSTNMHFYNEDDNTSEEIINETNQNETIKSDNEETDQENEETIFKITNTSDEITNETNQNETIQSDVEETDQENEATFFKIATIKKKKNGSYDFLLNRKAIKYLRDAIVTETNDQKMNGTG